MNPIVAVPGYFGFDLLKWCNLRTKGSMNRFLRPLTVGGSSGSGGRAAEAAPGDLPAELAAEGDDDDGDGDDVDYPFRDVPLAERTDEIETDTAALDLPTVHTAAGSPEVSLSNVELSRRAHTEFDTMYNLLLDQGVVPYKISHSRESSGREYFRLHFDVPIFEARRMRDTKSITFSCNTYGYEGAAHLAQVMYNACRGHREAGSFGCGVLKSNGFHGNDFNHFYVQPFELLKPHNSYNPQFDTFVPMKVFCQNSVQVRQTRTGVFECRCLGHPVSNVPDPSEIIYADDSRTQLLPKPTLLRNFLHAIEEIGHSKEWTSGTDLPHILVFGYDISSRSFIPPSTSLEDQVLKASLDWFRSARKIPVTSVIIAYNVIQYDVGDSFDTCEFVCFDRQSRRPLRVEIRPEESKNVVPVHSSLDTTLPCTVDSILRFEKRCHCVAFYCCKADEGEEFASELNSFGFVLGKSDLDGLSNNLSGFGIDRYRLFQMYRTGKDTRALMALLFWRSILNYENLPASSQFLTIEPVSFDRPAEEGAQDEDPLVDSWELREHGMDFELIRWHLVYRPCLFSPTDVDDCPVDVSFLKPERHSFGVHMHGGNYSNDSLWTDPDAASLAVPGQWIG